MALLYNITIVLPDERACCGNSESEFIFSFYHTGNIPFMNTTIWVRSFTFVIRIKPLTVNMHNIMRRTFMWHIIFLANRNNWMKTDTNFIWSTSIFPREKKKAAAGKLRSLLNSERDTVYFNCQKKHCGFTSSSKCPNR